MSANFTEAELKVLLRGWLCTDGGLPKMNYDKLAAVCGFKSKASASTRWSEARKKLNATFGEDGIAGSAADGDGDEDGATAAATPKKTPKKRTAKDAGAATDATPKRRGRKSKAEIAAAAAAAAAAEKGEDSDDEDRKANVKKEEAAEGDDDVNKLLTGAKEFSKMGGAGLIGADSDGEV